MRLFRYDIMQLIEGVRERPCIWDKNSVSYKDRTERRVAWEEVFRILDKSFDELSDEDKRLAGEHILNKWTNVRDTFIKSLKTKVGKPKKKYIFYSQLKFLIQSEDIAADDSSHADPELDDVDEPPPPEVKIERDEDSPKHSRRKRTRAYEPNEEQSKKIYDKPSSDLVEIEEYNDPRVMNEDEAFFASLLPSVVNYSEDERLEFRIQVLAVMKHINDKRKWPHVIA